MKHGNKPCDVCYVVLGDKLYYKVTLLKAFLLRNKVLPKQEETFYLNTSFKTLVLLWYCYFDAQASQYIFLICRFSKNLNDTFDFEKISQNTSGFVFCSFLNTPWYCFSKASNLLALP